MKKYETEYEKKAFRLVVVCWLAYTTVYVGKKTLSVCLADMIAAGVIDKVLGGTVGTCFLACYAAGQLINGWLGEKVHPKYMICGGLLLAGIMNVLMGLNSVPFLFAIIWALCGISCSMIWAPIIRAVSTWTTDEIAEASAASLSATIPCGTIICYLITAVMLKISWRAAFIACGAVLIVGAIVYYAVFGTLTEHMKTAPLMKVTKSPEGGGKAKGASLLCVGLVFCAFGILFNGMIKDGLDLWIPTALSERFINDSSIVSLICTIMPVFNLVGVYIAKWAFRHFGMTELGTCAWMFGISAGAIAVVLLFLKASIGGIFAAILVTLLLSLSSAAMLGANTMLLTFIPLHYGKIGRASAITGTLNCFSYVAAAVSGVAVGSLSEAFGWEMVFGVFVVAAALGCIACFIGKAPMKVTLDKLDSTGK